MIVAVPKETIPGEKRVAMVPDLVPKLVQAGVEIRLQSGAGVAAGFLDQAFTDKGASISPDVLEAADVILKVQPPTIEEISRIKTGAVLIGLLQPYSNSDCIQALADRKVSGFAMELMPRITRAQPMDTLSAMSTVSGYKGVLIAASRLPKFFPLLMTAAGT